MLSFICVVITKKGIKYSQFMHDAILSFIITTGRDMFFAERVVVLITMIYREQLWPTCKKEVKLIIEYSPILLL